MESALLAYRREKQSQARKASLKASVSRTLDSISGRVARAVLPDVPDQQDDNTQEDHAEDAEVQVPPRLTYLRWALGSLAWLFFFIAFLKIQFGAVYFCVSLLFLIYWNTRTRGRRRGEASAYSVFNEGCEALDGTLKGEHLERQLLYRGGS